MKLVFLTSRFPYPLEKGDKLRSYHFIKELSKSHEVILISLNETKVCRRAYSETHEKHC
jgi:polysaccharide biosynthesis protein PslH